MPHQLLSIVLDLNEIAKKNQTGPTACHWCNNQDNIIKYGKYKRYDFTGEELIDIQRYLCKHDQCRRTFSILPHPFLRFTRFPLCLLSVLLQLLDHRTKACAMYRRPLPMRCLNSDGRISAGHWRCCLKS